MTPRHHHQLEGIYAASFNDYLKNGPDEVCDFCWHELHTPKEEFDGEEYCCCPMPLELEAMQFASRILWDSCQHLPDDDYIALLNEFAGTYVRGFTVVHTGGKKSQMVSYEEKVGASDASSPTGTNRPLWLLLRVLMPERVREATLGDLEQEFSEIRQQKGERAARRMLAVQCLKSLRDALFAAAFSIATIYVMDGLKAATRHFTEWLMSVKQ